MLTLGTGYSTHLAGSVTQLATLWRITRTDTAVFRFTDHDADLIVPADGTYSSAGYNATAAKSSADLAVDNLEASAVFDSAAITEADLAAGLWDDATVEIMEVVWSDPSLGTRMIRKGNLGWVTQDGTVFRAELLGMMNKLQASIGRIVSPACDAILGDSRCAANLASFTHSLTVTSVTSRAQFTDSALAQAAGYFDFGLVTWTGGANSGRSQEIKQHQTGGVLTLFLPMVDDISVGDTATIIAGCDKTFATCSAKFSNVVNFRGFPAVPGNDRLFQPK